MIPVVAGSSPVVPTILAVGCLVNRLRFAFISFYILLSPLAVEDDETRFDCKISIDLKTC